MFVCTHDTGVGPCALRFETWAELMAHITTHPEREKRPYQPPTLTYLGTIEDLTRGVGGGSVDGIQGQTKVTGQ